MPPRVPLNSHNLRMLVRNLRTGNVAGVRLQESLAEIRKQREASERLLAETAARRADTSASEK